LSSSSYCAASPIDDGGGWYNAVLGMVGSQPSPALHVKIAGKFNFAILLIFFFNFQQIAIQPVEEQTLYWSAEDNPVGSNCLIFITFHLCHFTVHLQIHKARFWPANFGR
jgi:hypothetical protein